MTQTLNPQDRKRTLIALFSVVLLDLIGFALLVPTIPLLVKTYGASGTVMGLITSAYPLFQFLFAPLWGKLSDRMGRKKVLIFSILGAGFSMILLGFANTLFQIVLARMLGGMFAANIGVASAYITDITPEKDRTKSMGLIGVAFGLGFIIGPALGGILVQYGLKLPIFVTAGLNFINALYAMFVLRKDKVARDASEEKLTLRKIITHPLVFKICLANFVFTIALSQLETTFAYYMKKVFSSSNSQIYFLFTFLALTMALVQGGLIRRLAPKYSDYRLLVTGTVILGASFLFLPLMASVLLLLVPLTFSALGRGLAQPALTSMASKSLSVAMAGALMGVFTASSNLARVFGPSLAGLLFDKKPGLPFEFAGVLIFIVFGMAVFWIKEVGNKHDQKS